MRVGVGDPKDEIQTVFMFFHTGQFRVGHYSLRGVLIVKP